VILSKGPEEMTVELGWLCDPITATTTITKITRAIIPGIRGRLRISTRSITTGGEGGGGGANGGTALGSAFPHH